MYFQWSNVNKNFKKIEVGVFKQGDVVKKMFQKGCKISFRMYLKLCNGNFSRIDVEIEFMEKCYQVYISQ